MEDERLVSSGGLGYFEGDSEGLRSVTKRKRADSIASFRRDGGL
jgi:hypothetical protein